MSKIVAGDILVLLFFIENKMAFHVNCQLGNVKFYFL